MKASGGHWFGSALAVGAVFGLVLAAAVGGYAFYVARGAGAANEVDPGQRRVAVAFLTPGDDTGVRAGLILLVQRGRTVVVDPESTVAMPGLSAMKLGDVYSFGGGVRLAEAVSSTTGQSVSDYVVVPQDAWVQAVRAGGPIEVVLPEPVTAFDGAVLVTTPAGEQGVEAEEISPIVRATTFFSHSDRVDVLGPLAAEVFSALQRKPMLHLLETNLEETELSAWLAQARVKLPIR